MTKQNHIRQTSPKIRHSKLIFISTNDNGIYLNLDSPNIKQVLLLQIGIGCVMSFYFHTCPVLYLNINLLYIFNFIIYAYLLFYIYCIIKLNNDINF